MLTARRQQFVDAYLTCWNATKAARRAGYAYPRVEGCKLLTNPNIRAEIQRHVEERVAHRDEVLCILADHVRASMADFVDPQDSTVISLQQARDKGKLHLVKKLKYNRSGKVEIELVDAQRALFKVLEVLGIAGQGDPGVQQQADDWWEAIDE